MKTLTALVLAGALLAPLSFALSSREDKEQKTKLDKLPPAVQAAVKEQTKNATLVGVTKEVEKGKTQYEVETKVNGRTRDLILDVKGAVVLVEEEVDIASIPAAAKVAIEKAATGGKIILVERVTKGSVTYYEGHLKKKIKTSEVLVNADGTPYKDK